jgi:hypothetical protein
MPCVAMRPLPWLLSVLAQPCSCPPTIPTPRPRHRHASCLTDQQYLPAALTCLREGYCEPELVPILLQHGGVGVLLDLCAEHLLPHPSYSRTAVPAVSEDSRRQVFAILCDLLEHEAARMSFLAWEGACKSTYPEADAGISGDGQPPIASLLTRLWMAEEAEEKQVKASSSSSRSTSRSMKPLLYGILDKLGWDWAPPAPCPTTGPPIHMQHCLLGMERYLDACRDAEWAAHLEAAEGKGAHPMSVTEEDHHLLLHMAAAARQRVQETETRHGLLTAAEEQVGHVSCGAVQCDAARQSRMLMAPLPAPSPPPPPRIQDYHAWLGQMRRPPERGPVTWSDFAIRPRRLPRKCQVRGTLIFPVGLGGAEGDVIG